MNNPQILQTRQNESISLIGAGRIVEYGNGLTDTEAEGIDLKALLKP